MPLFTIEAHGRPVLVLPAEDEIAVEDQLSGSVGEDLTVLEYADEAGRPLWDGDPDQLVVREAQPEEADQWTAAFAKAVREGEADEEDRDSWAVFLIDVVDPTDDPASPSG
jgi:hypothetical protein